MNLDDLAQRRVCDAPVVPGCEAQPVADGYCSVHAREHAERLLRHAFLHVGGDDPAECERCGAKQGTRLRCSA